MEIINLKSATPAPTDGLKALVITDIKQAVKNQNRVNVFVNNEYGFSLDIAQLVDFKLKVGLELSAADLVKYKEASEFGKLYQRTLEWVLVRPRSVHETREYLSKKNTFLPFNDVIDKLLSKGYLDDKKFAEYYVENRFTKQGISAKRLKMELIKKGISNSIIEEVLNFGARNDEEEIKKLIAKKRARYTDDKKLMNYLARQGFSYDLIKSVLEKEDNENSWD